MFNTIENIQSMAVNQSEFNSTGANKTLRVKNILRNSRLFALLAIAIFTFTTGANNIQAEMTYEAASYLSPDQQKQTARYSAEMAFAASPVSAIAQWGFSVGVFDVTIADPRAYWRFYYYRKCMRSPGDNRFDYTTGWVWTRYRCWQVLRTR